MKHIVKLNTVSNNVLSTVLKSSLIILLSIIHENLYVAMNVIRMLTVHGIKCVYMNFAIGIPASFFAIYVLTAMQRTSSAIMQYII